MNYDYALTINIGDFNIYSPNKDYLLERITGNYTSGVTQGTNAVSMTGFESSGQETLGYRLLEISAASIFGSAKARAAISNDSEFINGTTIATVLVNELETELVNELANNDLNGTNSSNYDLTSVQFFFNFESNVVSSSTRESMRYFPTYIYKTIQITMTTS
jgi:hypothetical protein